MKKLVIIRINLINLVLIMTGGAMASTEQVIRLLKRKKTANMETLRDALGGCSQRSVFRYLERVGYLSSFTHAGKYYTLEITAQFDEQGLWFYQGIGFSRYGTLKETTAVQVELTAEGRTHEELHDLLRIRVHNTLLGLVRDGRIGRERFENVYLYVSADPDRAKRQIEKRRELIALVSEMSGVPSDEENVEVLVEALRAAPEIPKPDEISRRLMARGVRLEPHHVVQVFEAHHLVPGKKTARSSSRRSRH
jgi:predicted CopG family antitoxin